MCTNSERVLRRAAGPASRPLYSVAATRWLEGNHVAAAGAPSLMQTAGSAVARLAMALAPHAETVWIACGPGNNGGDGLQAAALLQQWGKRVCVTQAPQASPRSGDARAAEQAAMDAGVLFAVHAPQHFDLGVDALFGIGALRPFSDLQGQWIQQLRAGPGPLLAVDVPCGLDADSGAVTDTHVRADHTLALLTCKPGMFTAHGRDACGEIWFNDLGVPAPDAAYCPSAAELTLAAALAPRAHASHKGSYGDVAVVGGAPGMTGAALLAARAALGTGAGRVYVALLQATGAAYDAAQAELMLRAWDELPLARCTVVAGCGGGQAMPAVLPALLEHAQRLVLDADALNAIAQSPRLQDLTRARAPGSTVLTPHPLEAARLLGCSSDTVQAQRFHALEQLVDRFACCVVLKGSGTLVGAPGAVTRVNSSGSARLASAGTGDVLAGMVGSALASGLDALQACVQAVYRHGAAGDLRSAPVCTASALCEQLTQVP